MAGFSILVLSWLVPLHFLPWLSWHAEVLAFVAAAALFGGLLLERLRGRCSSIDIPRAALVFVVVAIVVAAQAAGGLIGFWGDAAVLELYIALCVVGLACGYMQGLRQAAHFESRVTSADPLVVAAWGLLVGGVASSLIALVQVFDVWPDVGWISRMEDLRRPGGNMGQPNHLGTLVMMGLASLVYLRQSARIQVPAALATALVLALGFAVAESRTALVGLALLTAWCMWGWSRRAVALHPRVTLVGSGSFIALYLAWPMAMGAIGWFTPGAGINTQPGKRLIVWRQLLEAVSMHPWQGWGLREVPHALNVVASGHATAEPFTYAHNLFIELAVGAGLPLAALFAAVVGTWAWLRVRQARSAGQWYCIAAVLPFFVHSMLEFPYAYAYFLLPVMYFIGFGEAAAGARALPRAMNIVALVALVPITLLAGQSVLDYVRAEEDFRVARFEALRVGKTPATYIRPHLVLLDQLGALLEAARLEPRKGMTAAELEVARKAAMRYSWPAIQNRYALALALNGDPVEAVRQLHVIRALHGDKAYRSIQANWQALAEQRYPELGKLAAQ